MKIFLGDHLEKVNMDQPMALFSAIYIGAIGAAVFLVQPGYVQGLVHYMGFTDVEAGYLSSGDMIGMAIGTILVSLLLTRLKWRPVMMWSLIMMGVGNAASAYIYDFTGLMLLRIVIGIAEGGVVPMTFAAIGMSSKPDRNFGLYIAGVLAYAAIALFAMPQAFKLSGMTGVFFFFSIFSFSGLLCLRYMPTTGHDDVHGQKGAHISFVLVCLALAAMLAYFIAQGIAWSYLFLIGTAGGLGEQATANALTLCQFFGVAGAATTAALGGRYGRALPLTFGILAGVLSMSVLFGDVSFIVYAGAVCLFNYAWNMVHPYLLASMASFDESGRVITWAVAMQTIGLGIGPSIGAYVIKPGIYDNINWSSMGFFILSLVCILIPVIASGGHRFRLNEPSLPHAA